MRARERARAFSASKRREKTRARVKIRREQERERHRVCVCERGACGEMSVQCESVKACIQECMYARFHTFAMNNTNVHAFKLYVKVWKQNKHALSFSLGSLRPQSQLLALHRNEHSSVQKRSLCLYRMYLLPALEDEFMRTC